MSNIDMEATVINECNALAEPHGIRVSKVKNRNSVKYCLMMEDHEIFCNTSIVDLHKFCQSEEDLKLLSSTSKSMIAMKEADEKK